MKKKPAPKGPLIAAVAVVVILTALAFILPLHDWTELLEDRVEAMDLGAGLLLFGIIYVVATLLLIPAWIFPVAAGAIFGFGWGSVVALAATAASSTLAFVTARYLLRGPVEKLARRQKLFNAFDKAVGKEGWRMVALLRLSPLLSFGIKNYFFGLTCVDLPAYLTGTLVGMLPGLMLKVWLGSAGRDVVSHGGPLHWTMLGVGIAATVISSVVVTRVTRARLKLAH